VRSFAVCQLIDFLQPEGQGWLKPGPESSFSPFNKAGRGSIIEGSILLKKGCLSP